MPENKNNPPKRKAVACVVLMIWFALWMAVGGGTGFSDNNQGGFVATPPPQLLHDPTKSSPPKQQQQQQQQPSLTEEKGCVIHETQRKTITVKTCFDPEKCHGEILIKPTSTPLNRKFSNDPETEKFLREDHGPDHYRFFLRSHNEVSGPPNSLTYNPEKNVYSGSIDLTKRGVHNIVLEVLYEEWNGIDEARDFWPPLLKEPILKLGTSALRERKTNYHEGQLSPSSDDILTCNNDQPKQNKNPCTGRETTGRWVVTDPTKKLFTKVRSKKVQKTPVVFQWDPQIDEAWEWSFDTCTLPTTNVKDLPRKSILVTGDSQLRSIYFGLVNFLQGNGLGCVRNISTPQHMNQYLFASGEQCVENVKGKQKATLRNGEVSLHFLDDPYLDKVHKNGRHYSAVVGGFGQHPASRKHWPFKRFNTTMADRAVQVNSLLTEGKTFVWVTSPKYPDTKKGYPVGVKDWRTDPRLIVFNSAAKSHLAPLLREHDRLRLVDTFPLTQLMGHTSSDQAHYNNFVLYEIVRIVASYLY
eukprot:TRINITY_DN2831_c0_g1_i1.p1 TRINITY_DN2831_c0_g1~~TRINITY_DN2831_c0_g1_i1.p1  ORF type:complete len:548 (+),score=71.09 TRINITY_DN2831_c0_g1_i1:66-1646(+)